MIIVKAEVRSTLCSMLMAVRITVSKQPGPRADPRPTRYVYSDTSSLQPLRTSRLRVNGIDAHPLLLQLSPRFKNDDTNGVFGQVVESDTKRA